MELGIPKVTVVVVCSEEMTVEVSAGMGVTVMLVETSSLD